MTYFTCGAFGAVLALYLLVPTKNYYWDGISFALNIEESPGLVASLLHPNHLLYNVVGRLLYDGVRAFGFDSVRALDVLRVTNSILSTASALLLWHILQRTLGSRYLSLSLALLFSFSATWWKFSTDANSYIPSICLLLLCCRFLLPADAPRPLLIAFLHAASMLLHQLAVFFYPVALLGLWQQATTTARTPAMNGKRRPSTPLLLYSASVFLLTFGSYGYGFYLSRGSFQWRPFLAWMTSFSPEVSFSFSLRNNLFYSARGHLRLMLDGKVGAALRQGDPLTLALVMLMLVLCGLLCWQAWRHRADLKEFWRAAFVVDKPLQPILRLALVWTAVYLLFLFFWLPHNTFYRLFYLPALLLLAGVFLAQYTKTTAHPRRYRLALGVAVAMLFNFVSGSLLYARLENNEPLALALAMRSGLPAGSVIYYGQRSTDTQLFMYFNPTIAWRPLPAGDLAQVDAELKNSSRQPASVWIDITAIELLRSTPHGQQWLAERMTHRSYELIDKRYKIRYVQILPTSTTETAQAGITF